MFYFTGCSYSFSRPIAGAINFCPAQFPLFSDEDNIRIGIHEVIHTLVSATQGYSGIGLMIKS